MGPASSTRGGAGRGVGYDSLAALMDYLTKEEENRQVSLSALADQLGTETPVDQTIRGFNDFRRQAGRGMTQLGEDIRGSRSMQARDPMEEIATIPGHLLANTLQGAGYLTQFGEEDWEGLKTAAGTVAEEAMDPKYIEGGWVRPTAKAVQPYVEEPYKIAQEMSVGEVLPGAGLLAKIGMGMAVPAMKMGKTAAKAAPTLEERAAAVGHTSPAYHGSTHDIKKFDLNRSNIENHMGQAHYFTTSPKDAGANYGGMGPDLTARIRREAEQMDDVPMDELIDMVDDTVRRQYEAKMQATDARIKVAYDEEMALINQSMGEHKVTAGRQVRPPGMDERLQELSEVQRKGRLEKDKIDSELLLEAAKTNLKGPSEGMVYDVQLRLDNPLHIDGSKKEPVFEIETVFDDAGEFVEERGNGIELIEAMHDAAADFDADAERIVQEFIEKSGDDMMDGMKASEVDSALRRLDSIYEVYDDIGDNASTEFIRQVYENLGYDSVIMDPAKAFPHMGNVPTGTRHYIVFDKYANKIRSKRAAFDPKKLGSRDIMATVTPIAAPGLTAAYLANQEQE